MYLLVKPEGVVELAQLKDALLYLNIGNVNGQIHFENMISNMSYSSEWTEEDSLIDFIRYSLNKCSSVTGISIYKAELL